MASNIFLTLGGLRRHEIYLEVQSYPEVTVNPFLFNFQTGDNVTIECYSRGVPPPAIWWKKEDAIIDRLDRLDKRRIYVDEEDRLRIFGARIEDEGEYACEGRNIAGEGK